MIVFENRSPRNSHTELWDFFLLTDSWIYLPKLYIYMCIHVHPYQRCLFVFHAQINICIFRFACRYWSTDVCTCATCLRLGSCKLRNNWCGFRVRFCCGQEAIRRGIQRASRLRWRHLVRKGVSSASNHDCDCSQQEHISVTWSVCILMWYMFFRNGVGSLTWSHACMQAPFLQTSVQIWLYIYTRANTDK